MLSLVTVPQQGSCFPQVGLFETVEENHAGPGAGQTIQFLCRATASHTENVENGDLPAGLLPEVAAEIAFAHRSHRVTAHIRVAVDAEDLAARCREQVAEQ